MKTINVCFVGIGSIAKRHIKNLRKIAFERTLSLEIDAVRHQDCSAQDKEKLGLNQVYTDISQVNKVYDVIFITNPTEYHIDTLKEVENNGKNFFIEKPISSLKQLERVKNLQMKKDAVYYVACPLRYHSVIQYIKQHVNVTDVISVRSISSSYLPDWRPGTDYRETYSAHKDLGGGVSIDLIHEWDYLVYLFGMPDSIECKMGKKSNLEIDSDDFAIYIAEYKDKIVELHLDYFGRIAIRRIELITNEDTIIGDLLNYTVTYLKTGRCISLEEERDDFQRRELDYFFNAIENSEFKLNEITHAVQILKLTQGII